ncbi:hypothetical protein HYDPIDRAFT_118830, partial [Hydnomerulius pinastri MD-312]
SPNGRILLTRLARTVKVWTEDGVCKKTIERPNPVTSVVWPPTGKEFLFVEGSEVVKLVLDSYHLGEVRLVNVAVTSDCVRLIGAGPSTYSPNGPQPHTRVGKCIIVYNMSTKTRESQTPVANSVCDISISRKMSSVLISREKAPPQLWELEIIRDRERSELAYTSRLSFKHTFAFKGRVRIVGPCHFGGKEDQFVLCAGKAGDIHIWDRETATLLRHLLPAVGPVAGDLTCIAWNYASDDPMMFATGCHDGTVRIWSTVPQDSASERSSNASFLDLPAVPRPKNAEISRQGAHNHEDDRLDVTTALPHRASAREKGKSSLPNAPKKRFIERFRLLRRHRQRSDVDIELQEHPKRTEERGKLKVLKMAAAKSKKFIMVMGRPPQAQASASATNAAGNREAEGEDSEDGDAEEESQESDSSSDAESVHGRCWKCCHWFCYDMVKCYI